MIDTKLFINIDAVERTALAPTLGGKLFPMSVGWDAVRSTVSGETAM